jgi:hypothetical protein
MNDRCKVDEEKVQGSRCKAEGNTDKKEERRGDVESLISMVFGRK